MSKKSWIKIDLADFQALHGLGWHDTELANHFGISGSSVVNLRARFNMKANRCRVKFDKEMYIKLFTAGVIYPEVARCFGISEHV